MKNKIINIFVILGITLFALIFGVKAATTLFTASDVTYSDTTVQEKLDELMEIASIIEEITKNECVSGNLCSKVALGDYVSMTPTQTTYTIPASATGYTSDQTINPSELNLWRVININNDGTIDLVSEYVSSTAVYFKGQTGYLNYVGVLNTIANQYSNSKYVESTRHMGYNGQTATITDTSKFTTTAPWTSHTSDNSNEAVGGGDTLYERDTNLVKTALGTLVANKVGTTTTTNYYLASRNYFYNSATYYRWLSRIVYTGGYVSNSYLYNYNSGWSDISSSRAVRPIVTLKSDITTYSGSGTSDSPWVLS